MWATEDELLNQQPRLQGLDLSRKKQEMLDEVLKKWDSVPSDVPGMTDILVHDINTGEAPPVRATPYQVPLKW